ncbi:MAG: S1C family serine protease [Bacillota bacterium]
MKEELNRKYQGREELSRGELEERFKSRRRMLGLTALLLALVFLFSVTGRWLVLFTGPAFTFLQESWALADDPVVEDLRGAVVQVFVESRGNTPRGSMRGSGFNLHADGLVVTNRHMVENAVSVRVSFPGVGMFTVGKWTVYHDADLAVLEFEAENLPVVELSGAPVYLDQEVLVIGNPLQFARIANRGEVVGYRDNPQSDIPLIIVEAMIYPGSSGSPVFNELGEVVGVIYATLRNSEPAEVKGLAVSAAELRQFLSEFEFD